MKRVFRKIAAWAGRYADACNYTCDLCGREVFEGERICAVCRDELPFNTGEICPVCGRRVQEAGICIECKASRPAAERARSCFVHEGDALALIVRFKRGDRYLFRTLSAFLAPLAAQEFPDADVFISVPMTKRALRRRGYNQSRLLAEETARLCGKPYRDAVVKRRETQSQKLLGRSAREKNLEGCFSVTVRDQVRGKRVLIVDDTFTTGATVNELARTLLRAGAASVCALTLTSVAYMS